MVMYILLLTMMSISLIFLLITLVLSMKMHFSREKLSPFECGFDAQDSSRNPFSLQFFMIAVVFLVFDVEIVILLPLPMMYNLNEPSHLMVAITSFLMILLLGTYYEWGKGALDWIK